MNWEIGGRLRVLPTPMSSMDNSMNRLQPCTHADLGSLEIVIGLQIEPARWIRGQVSILFGFGVSTLYRSPYFCGVPLEHRLGKPEFNFSDFFQVHSLLGLP